MNETIDVIYSDATKHIETRVWYDRCWHCGAIITVPKYGYRDVDFNIYNTKEDAIKASKKLLVKMLRLVLTAMIEGIEFKDNDYNKLIFIVTQLEGK